MADRDALQADRGSEIDALRALEARLERATEAAERLLSDAAQATGPPPAGWQAPHDGGPSAGGGGSGGAGGGGGATGERFGGWLRAEDAELLLGLLAGVRERIPSELQQRLAGAVHEVLLALRALIDWCLERAERRQAAPPEVQDIPIL